MPELRSRDPRFPSHPRFSLPDRAALSLRPISPLDSRHTTQAAEVGAAGGGRAAAAACEAAQAGASVTVTPVPDL